MSDLERDRVRWHAAHSTHHGPPWHPRGCPVCDAERERYGDIDAILLDARLHPFAFIGHVLRRMWRDPYRSLYLATLRRVACECVAEARELRKRRV